MCLTTSAAMTVTDRYIKPLDFVAYRSTQTATLHSHLLGGATYLSHSFARQPAGLLDPVGELRFIELVLVDVEVAHFIVLRLSRGERMQ